MSDANRFADVCVDCGSALLVCEHAIAGITDPMLAFQGKVIEEVSEKLSTLTAELEAARASEAGALALAGQYREALIEDVKYDDGTFMQTYRRCRWCWWSDRAEYGEPEHQPDCPYLWTDRAAALGRAVESLDDAAHNAVAAWRQTQDGPPSFTAMRQLERSVAAYRALAGGRADGGGEES